MGFPVRPARTDFGPILRDERMREDPRSELCADQLNLIFHQVAGGGLTCPLAVMMVNPATPRLLYGLAAWDQVVVIDQDPPHDWLTLVVNGTGSYTLQFPADAPDENDDAREIIIRGAVAAPIVPTASSAVYRAYCEVVDQSTVNVTVKTLAGADQDSSFVLIVW